MRRFRQRYALERVESLVGAAMSGHAVDPLVHEWLASGFVAYLRDEAPLEVALGLTGRGKDSPRHALLLALRDLHLCRAIDAMEVDPADDPWPRCVQLASLAARFVSDTWPRARVLERAPAEWPAYRRALFAAMKTGHDLPTSAKQLHRIATRNARFSCPEPPLTVLAKFI